MPAITSIQIFPLRHTKLLANATIVLDDCFVLSGLKIVDGCNGLFVAMPVVKSRDGKFVEVAYPLSIEFNRYLGEQVLKAYQKVGSGRALDHSRAYAGA